LLPSTVQPLASTGCSPCSTSSAAWKARCPAIRPTILSGTAKTPFAFRSRSLDSPALIFRSKKENTLTIRGEKQANDEEKIGEVLYKGIAERTFERSFQLADHVVVKGARLENGLLHVDLVREIPEAMKPRRFRSRVPTRCWGWSRPRSLPEALTLKFGSAPVSGALSF
jgi:Hsp20/alpha crystallin family protein